METIDENEIIKRCVEAGLNKKDVEKMLEIEDSYMEELGII